MGYLIHDKRGMAGLGILVEAMDFNNWNYKLDQIWNDGIISVQIDADRVNPNGNYIATRIIKKRY